MKIKSFGKINLNLRVLDELVNGLHKIESLIVPIDLYDVIEIKEIKNDKDIITFDSMNIPENNTVSKSLNNLSAQIIDDNKRKTLVSASSIEKEIKGKKIKKMEKSALIGEMLAKRAKEKKIEKVYFDRGENKYHGRIKNFADSLRKNGLKF